MKTLDSNSPIWRTIVLTALCLGAIAFWLYFMWVLYVLAMFTWLAHHGGF